MTSEHTGRPGFSHLTLEQGDKVGDFEILEQIGAGGSSVVFKARDPLLGRFVAVKQVLLEEGEDDEAITQRVAAEARAQKKAADVAPRHLVQFLDVIAHPKGLMIVSEYVEGQSLEQLLAGDPSPMRAKRALGIVAATAAALEAMHKRGIIHRDLKPANILLPKDGGLKVTDFGLAAAIGADDQLEAGTVRYMAPELLRAEPADERADVYSLGMIAYEMLAGRAKFDEAFRSVLRDQRNQGMRWMKWHTNARARATSLTTLVPDLEPAAAELVERMMDKEASARVSSAKQVVDAIQRHFTGEAPGPEPGDQASTGPAIPVHAKPTTSSPGDTAPLPKRQILPWVLTATLVMWLAIGGGLGYSVLMEKKSADAARLGAASEALEKANAQYTDGHYVEALQAFDRLAEDWPADTEFGKVAEAGRLVSRARLHEEAERYDAAAESYRLADDLGVYDRAELAKLIRTNERRADFAGAIAKIEGFIENRQFADAQRELRAWSALAFDESEEQWLRQLSERMRDQEAQANVEAILAQAKRMADRGERAEAVALLEKGDRLMTDPRVQDLHTQLKAKLDYDGLLAQALRAESDGNLPEAVALYSRANDMRPSDDTTAKLSNLRSRLALQEGVDKLESGDIAGAEAALTRALGFDPNNARARETLETIASSTQKAGFIKAGDDAYAQKDFDSAVKQYQNALALGADTNLATKLNEAKVRRAVQRGRQLVNRRKLEEAKPFVQEALQLAPEDRAVISLSDDLAKVERYLAYRDAGDAARAESDFGEAKRNYFDAQELMNTREIRERIDQAEYGSHMANARSLIDQKMHVAALARLREAYRIFQTDEARELIEEVAKRVPTDESSN